MQQRPVLWGKEGGNARMNNKIIPVLILLFFPFIAFAINAVTKQKYPYSVLTNDYGILNEIDLDSYKDGVKPPSSLPKEGFGYIYWQCFPRDAVSINLEDMGYSSEDIGRNENDGDIKITVIRRSGVFHEYVMRRMWPVSGYEKKFNLWIKLMKNEKSVCLAGSFVHREDRVVSGKKQRIYLWVFDKIKTKKGCDSYFEDGCHRSMEKN